MSKRVKLVPLLREGADDLERTLLAAARHDGPPDPVARSRTLAALRTASRTAAVTGAGAAGWRWLQLLKPAAIPWLAIGGLGVAVTLGAGPWLLRGGPLSPELPSRGAARSVVAPASAQAAAPVVLLSSPRPAPSIVARATTASVPSGLPPTGRAPSPPAGRAGAPAPPRGAPRVASTAALVPSPPPPLAPTVSGVTNPIPPPPLPEDEPVSPLAGAGASEGNGTASPLHAAPSSSLRQEAALLEFVRESLAASRIDRALASLDEHDARFPSGALEEEAIVLHVEALLATRRLDEARGVTADFERKHPASSYVRRLRALVEAK